MYLHHAAYWFRPRVGKPVRLATELPDALAKYASLVGADSWRSRTLGDVIDRYRIEVLPKKRSEQTREDEGRYLDRLKRVFGHVLPDNISAQDCYRYMDQRRTKAGMPAPVAARHEIALLGHVFSKAIRWGLTSRNPVRGLDFGGRGARRARVPLEEVEKLRALASERMRVAIDLAVSVGQRRGDLLTLRKDQCTDDGIVFRQSKTGAGVLIKWSADLHAIVDRAKALAPQIPNDYLLRKRDGKPYSPHGFKNMWRRLMVKHVAAGGQRFTFHDLRSVSADGAETPEEARDRLGHASVETTKRHYLRGLTKAKPRS